jgi:hypothetical protein
MRFLFRGRVRWAALVAIVAGLVGGGIAYASIPDSNGVIHGCYKTQNGQLRVINTPGQSCNPSENALNWNQTGPAGPAGGQGPAGPAGPRGATGATGPSGSSIRAWGQISGNEPLVQRGVGITGVYRYSTGQYCVFVDPSIDLSTAVALVSPWTFSPGSGFSVTAQAGGCTVSGLGTGVYVATWGYSGFIDGRFTIAVP